MKVGKARAVFIAAWTSYRQLKKWAKKQQKEKEEKKKTFLTQQQPFTHGHLFFFVHF